MYVLLPQIAQLKGRFPHYQEFKIIYSALKPNHAWSILLCLLLNDLTMKFDYEEVIDTFAN